MVSLHSLLMMSRGQMGWMADEAVREYWTRQWTLVSPLVEPKQFKQATNDVVIVEVQQSVRDLEGKPLQDQTHGLHDTVVGHVFHFYEGKVVRFDIQDVAS